MHEEHFIADQQPTRPAHRTQPAVRHPVTGGGGRAARKGNCFDNVAMKGFWGSLKGELVDWVCFTMRTEVRAIRFE